VQFEVRFQATADLDIRVEADGYDEALDAAYSHKDGLYLCGHCSGASDGEHNLMIPIMEMEAHEVVDDTGKSVWTSRTYIEELQSQITGQEKTIARLERELQEKK
jgi:hypothetical protein